MTQPTDPPTPPQHPAPPPQDPEGAGGQENGSEWPLRGRGRWRAEDLLTVLRDQAPLHPPLGYPYTVAVPWAYDTIRELTGAVRALSLPPHFTDVSIEGTEGPWRTGQSVVPKVTLYKGNQIVGLALSAEIAAEIVARCNATETGPQVITTTETRTLSAGVAEIDVDALDLLIQAAGRYYETPRVVADGIDPEQLAAAITDAVAIYNATAQPGPVVTDVLACEGSYQPFPDPTTTTAACPECGASVTVDEYGFIQRHPAA